MNMKLLTAILFAVAFVLMIIALAKIGLKHFFEAESRRDSYLTFRSRQSPIKTNMLIKSH
jgi:hypothetical protein